MSSEPANVQTKRSHVKHAGQAHGPMLSELASLKMTSEMQAQCRLAPVVHHLKSIVGVCPVPVVVRSTDLGYEQQTGPRSS